MRALLRPGWVLTHLIVLATVALFVLLGLWQVRRSGEVALENERIAAMSEAAPQPAGTVLAAGGDIDLRPVTARGRYVPDAQVTLSPRSRNDVPGFHVLTPLRLDDGRVVLVDRGWVPLDVEPPPPPLGEVAIQARLRAPVPARQVLRDEDGTVTSVSGVEPAVLQGQVDGLVGEAWMEAVDDAALQAGTIPRPAEPVVLDAGPHLSYAFQWFAFATIVLVGYPLLLRRRIADQRPGGVRRGRADEAIVSPRP